MPRRHLPAAASFARAFLAIALLAAGGCAAPHSEPLTRGLAAFGAREFDRALPLFESAVAGSPRDATARCWLAETRRRLGRLEEAARDARAALAVDPRSSFAETVLADCYDPVMSVWESADAESTWTHNRRAVVDDPRNGDAWLSVWKHAVARGDAAWERRSLEELSRIGFFTRPVLAYNRWQLEHLPANAVLLTNGDMDTFPSVVLQGARGVRRDVVVVNLSLLNWPEYAMAIARRAGLTLPLGIDAPEVARSRVFQDGRKPSGISSRTIAEWVDELERGALGRPLTVAATVPDVDVLAPALAGRLTLAGPFYEVSAAPGAPAEDLARLRTALGTLKPADFAGPWASTLDRSPIRGGYPQGMGPNVMTVAWRWGRAAIAAGNRADALAAASKLERLAHVLGAETEARDMIRELREGVRGL